MQYMDTCNIESIQKPEEAIYNIRLFMKIIRTIWKLIIIPFGRCLLLCPLLGGNNGYKQCSGD